MIELIEDINAIEIGLEALNFQFPISDIYRFKIKSLCNDEDVVGSVFYDGPEIHIAIFPEYRRRWASRRIIRDILKHPFDEYGYAITMGFESDRDFLERIGFKEQFRINDITYYRIQP